MTVETAELHHETDNNIAIIIPSKKLGNAAPLDNISRFCGTKSAIASRGSCNSGLSNLLVQTHIPVLPVPVASNPPATLT